nr:hypothetical protein [Candidatus Sigynarchaeota archaeon]
MTSKKYFLASGIAVSLLLVCCTSSVLATPSWLPARANIAGYSLAWDEQMDFFDFTSINGSNITLYTQFWFKNDTSSNITNLLAAGMLDKGGSLFMRSPQFTTPIVGPLLEIPLAAFLNMSAAQYDNLTSVWEVLVLLLQVVGAEVGFGVNESVISNMDKALIITDPSGFWEFDYMLFGFREERILSEFAFTTGTQFLTLIEDPTANNGTIYNLFKNLLTYALAGFMLLFVEFAKLFPSNSGSLAVAAAPSDIKVTPSDIAPSDMLVTEMTAFASAWGEIAGAPAIPGFDVTITGIFTAVAVVVIGMKLKKSRKA